MAEPSNIKPSTPSLRQWNATIFNWVARGITLVVLSLLAFEVYRYLLDDILEGKSYFWAFLLLWLFSAYIVLPRVHRRLAKIYLPNYFIGRARTGDGLLGDPINLAIMGTQTELIKAMQQAGWARAEELSWRSAVKMIVSSLGGKSYATAPVSALFLLGHKQTLAFEQQIGGNPRRRHHVRFWKMPKRWWLPGGAKADWLGAATYDKHVGLSLFTGQITHKIDQYVDTERDFVIKTLADARMIKSMHTAKHFVSGYHGRNGEGDRVVTDGSLPFVTLRS